MGLWNLGSIATAVLDRTDNVSTTVSGALVQIADEERLFAEEFTGLTIGSVGIAEKFQPALVQLTQANTLNLMQLTGGDFSETTLGEFKVKKGADSNLSAAARPLHDDALMKLKALGMKMRFSQSLS